MEMNTKSTIPLNQFTSSFATTFPHSKGNYKLRFILSEGDAKTKIAACQTFVRLVEFFDKLLSYLFISRKWVRVYVKDQEKTKPILLNIQSLVKRTLLARNEILSKSAEELTKLLSNPKTILWEYKKLKETFPKEQAFLISLKDREDRRKNIQNHLDQIGENDFSYTLIPAIYGKDELNLDAIEKMSKSDSAKKSGKDDRAGRLGCYLSHLKALKKAKKENLPFVFIMEDDVRFMPHAIKGNYLQKAFKELPDDWGMLFLGHYDANPAKKTTYSEHLVQPGCPYDLHAYVVNQTMYDSLILALKTELKKKNDKIRAIDVVIGEEVVKTKRLFACKENIAIQDEGFSSITSQHIAGNYTKELTRLKKILHPNPQKTADQMPKMDPLISGTLYQMAHQMAQIFDKHNIQYWADSGTILGIERHGGLIPHDDDIDICLAPGEEEKLKLPEVIEDFKKANLQITDHWLGAKICAAMSHPKGKSITKDGYQFKTPNIDLFFTQKHLNEDGQLAFKYATEKASQTWPELYYLSSEIFDSKEKIPKMKFGPTQICSPHLGSTFCKRFYGKNCFSEIYLQYDHINEKGLKSRPVQLHDYRLADYKEWDQLSPIKAKI